MFGDHEPPPLNDFCIGAGKFFRRVIALVGHDAHILAGEIVFDQPFV